MPNGFQRSRSPVRAINSAVHQTWADNAPSPRTWSEPEVRHVAAVVPAISPAHEQPHLECPDCGSMLRLALVPVSAEAPGAADFGARPSPTETPDPRPLPDFEESIREHKRSLVTRALRENSGVMTNAAKALGLKYTTFVAMVHRLNAFEKADGAAST